MLRLRQFVAVQEKRVRPGPSTQYRANLQRSPRTHPRSERFCISEELEDNPTWQLQEFKGGDL